MRAVAHDVARHWLILCALIAAASSCSTRSGSAGEEAAGGKADEVTACEAGELDPLTACMVASCADPGEQGEKGCLFGPCFDSFLGLKTACRG
jgi:hypothetical protein